MLLTLPRQRRRMQCDRCKAVGYVTYEDRGDSGCFYCGNQMYDVHAKERTPRNDDHDTDWRDDETPGKRQS